MDVERAFLSEELGEGRMGGIVGLEIKSARGKAVCILLRTVHDCLFFKELLKNKVEGIIWKQRTAMHWIEESGER